MFAGKDEEWYRQEKQFDRLSKDLRLAGEREKKWQEKCGKLASIANSISVYIDESKIPSNEIDEYKDKLEFVREYLSFCEF